MPAADADVVEAYWRHHRLTQGDRRQRLASEELRWTVEAVDEAMEGDDPLTLLDLLVDAPEADLCFLGAGPVEDLLHAAGARWEGALAERCRSAAEGRPGGRTSCAACGWTTSTGTYWRRCCHSWRRGRADTDGSDPLS